MFGALGSLASAAGHATHLHALAHFLRTEVKHFQVDSEGVTVNAGGLLNHTFKWETLRDFVTEHVSEAHRGRLADALSRASSVVAATSHATAAIAAEAEYEAARATPAQRMAAEGLTQAQVDARINALRPRHQAPPATQTATRPVPQPDNG